MLFDAIVRFILLRLSWKDDIEKGVPLRDLKCVTANEQGRVTKIMASVEGLEGTLPPSIGMLDALESLFVPGNGGLTGGIPNVRSLSSTAISLLFDAILTILHPPFSLLLSPL